MLRNSTINHQPSTINHQPSTINHQPADSVKTVYFCCVKFHHAISQGAQCLWKNHRHRAPLCVRREVGV